MRLIKVGPGSHCVHVCCADRPLTDCSRVAQHGVSLAWKGLRCEADPNTAHSFFIPCAGAILIYTQVSIQIHSYPPYPCLSAHQIMTIASPRWTYLAAVLIFEIGSAICVSTTTLGAPSSSRTVPDARAGLGQIYEHVDRWPRRHGPWRSGDVEVSGGVAEGVDSAMPVAMRRLV
jgi:hypothetical protein